MAPQRRRAVRMHALSLSVVVVATGTLTACGSDTSTESSGPVDLTMTVWTSNESHLAVLNQIADSYIAEHPDEVASVTYEPLTGGDYITALTTQIAGGDAPDMAWIFEDNARSFVESGVLVDLTPVMEATDGYDIDDLIPGAMVDWELDGDYYAYPFSSSPVGVLVNLDLIEAAGQPDPRELLDNGEWTWDALMEISAAVSDAGGSSVGGFSPGDPYTQWQYSLTSMWPAWGAEPWDETGTECTFTDPEMVDFLDWFHDQVYVEGASPAPGEVYDFMSGQLASSLSQMSRLGSLDGSFAYDFLPLPEGPAGVAPIVGQAGVGAVARGENPEQAADFLAYFTNPENAALLAEFFPPPRESLLTVETLTEAAPNLTPVAAETTIIDQAINGTVKAGHVNMASLTDRIRAGLDELWTPEGDGETAAAAVCESIQPYLTAD